MTSKWRVVMAAVVVIVAATGGYCAYRLHRVWSVARGFETQIRYLIENGSTIGEAPASETFSADYLSAVFGDNPDLLEKLRSVVKKGLTEDPSLNLGEVSAMIVTYHKTDDDKVEDLVVHAMGGFAIAREKPGFHRGGYFFQQVDPNLWNYGNILIGFLGRDMVLFATSDAESRKQQALIDSLFTGDISMFIDTMARPMYFTAVFPEPSRILPPQLRKHVQAVVVKGKMSHYEGQIETLIMTPSPQSASYTLSILRDLKIASETALKTRWKGVARQTEWGEVIDPWWAYELVQNSQRITMEKEQNLIRIKNSYERVMCNVVFKSVERLSRDLAQMRGTLNERLDPRVVDAKLATSKPLHYWSEPHRWGPDWPIPPLYTNQTDEAQATNAAPARVVSTATNQAAQGGSAAP